MQHGPGAENAFGGVAQAFGESVPMLFMPAGYERKLANYFPNFNSQFVKFFDTGAYANRRRPTLRLGIVAVGLHTSKVSRDPDPRRTPRLRVIFRIRQEASRFSFRKILDVGLLFLAVNHSQTNPRSPRPHRSAGASAWHNAPASAHPATAATRTRCSLLPKAPLRSCWSRRESM